jgi:metal-responsive CopG/Arc/MetJ family transcriptional regulator
MLQGMDTEIQLSNEPPTRSPSQRRVTSIALTDELIARLDRYAKEAKVSRSWVIVRVLEVWLDGQESADD